MGISSNLAILENTSKAFNLSKRHLLPASSTPKCLHRTVVAARLVWQCLACIVTLSAVACLALHYLPISHPWHCCLLGWAPPGLHSTPWHYCLPGQALPVLCSISHCCCPTAQAPLGPYVALGRYCLHATNLEI